MLLFKVKRWLVLVLQWLFAIVAFSTCIDFSTSFDYSVTCADGAVVNVSHPIKYPFELDKRTSRVTVTCSNANDGSFSMSVYIPGDYELGAMLFFAFGFSFFLVTSFAIIMHILYLFSETETETEIELVILAQFICAPLFGAVWLAFSIHWCVGVATMQYDTAPDNWLFRNAENGTSICSKDLNGQYRYVKNCEVLFGGNFDKANVSVTFGFLSVLLCVASIFINCKSINAEGATEEIEASKRKVAPLEDETDLADVSVVKNEAKKLRNAGRAGILDKSGRNKVAAQQLQVGPTGYV